MSNEIFNETLAQTLSEIENRSLNNQMGEIAYLFWGYLNPLKAPCEDLKGFEAFKDKTKVCFNGCFPDRFRLRHSLMNSFLNEKGIKWIGNYHTRKK